MATDINTACNPIGIQERSIHLSDFPLNLINRPLTKGKRRNELNPTVQNIEKITWAGEFFCASSGTKASVSPKPAAVSRPSEIARYEGFSPFLGQAIKQTAIAVKAVAIQVSAEGVPVRSKKSTKDATNIDFDPIIGVIIDASPFLSARKQVACEMKKIPPSMTPA